MFHRGRKERKEAHHALSRRFRSKGGRFATDVGGIRDTVAAATAAAVFWNGRGLPRSTDVGEPSSGRLLLLQRLPERAEAILRGKQAVSSSNVEASAQQEKKEVKGSRSLFLRCRSSSRWRPR